MTCGVEADTIISLCIDCWANYCLDCFINGEMEHYDNCNFTQ